MNLDKKYDLSSKNICLVECGGKNNIHIFMRILNRFRIPYIVLHDFDSISFPEDKPEKTEEEKQRLKMFKENAFIRAALDESVGRIIVSNPEFEAITEVTKNQTEKQGKIQAAYEKYDNLDPRSYPSKLMEVIDLVIDWSKPGSIFMTLS